MKLGFFAVAILIAATIFTVTSMPIKAAESADHKLYLKHLRYEYNNRTFAYIGMKKTARILKDKPAGSFYQAYYELEVISQDVYQASALAIGFDYSPGWFARFRGHLGGAAAYFITFSPQSLINIIEPYIAKLEELRDLSDPQHRGFFDYIVAQETAQLEASRVAKEEGWEQGAQVLREFIASIEVEKVTASADQ